MTWSSSQYLQFEDDRSRPVRDLLAAVPADQAARAVDLGCGPGNSTELLAKRFPMAAITGVDSSEDMLRAARERLPELTFDLADIAEWSPAEAPDIILANAALQWLPDHTTLFPRLVQMLPPGGSLAVQMPDNMDDPSQALMRLIAAESPWAASLGQAAGHRPRLESADIYYRLLKQHATKVDMWRTTYMHVLPGGTEAVVEWFKGSGLRPFLAPLAPADRDSYLARYHALMAQAHPPLPDGSVILPFPRLFLVATR